MTHPDEHAGYEAGVMAPLACVPNLDGQITLGELKAVLGVPIKYLVSPANKTRTVDVAGTVDANGKRVWDMGVHLADDQTLSLTATTLDGKWYASSFPNGQFVTPFDSAGTLDGIYSQDDQAIRLHGVASTKPNVTLLAYDVPIVLFKLPLTVGSSWSSTGTVKNGMLNGSPWAQVDTYEATDDAAGTLIVPDLTFTQAHRVRFKVTVNPVAGGMPIVTEQVSFMFECFGEIARVTSNPGETNQDFTTAKEVRRFGL